MSCDKCHGDDSAAAAGGRRPRMRNKSRKVCGSIPPGGRHPGATQKEQPRRWEAKLNDYELHLLPPRYGRVARGPQRPPPSAAEPDVQPRLPRHRSHRRRVGHEQRRRDDRPWRADRAHLLAHRRQRGRRPALDRDLAERRALRPDRQPQHAPQHVDPDGDADRIAALHGRPERGAAARVPGGRPPTTAGSRSLRRRATRSTPARPRPSSSAPRPRAGTRRSARPSARRRTSSRSSTPPTSRTTTTS